MHTQSISGFYQGQDASISALLRAAHWGSGLEDSDVWVLGHNMTGMQVSGEMELTVLCGILKPFFFIIIINLGFVPPLCHI